MSSGLIPGLSVYKGKMLKRADGEIKKTGTIQTGKREYKLPEFQHTLELQRCGYVQ